MHTKFFSFLIILVLLVSQLAVLQFSFVPKVYATSTTWYFHSSDVEAGPTAEASTDIDSFTSSPSDKNTAKAMNTTIGTAQTSVGGSYNQVNGGTEYSMLRIFVGPSLAAQTLTGSQANYKVALDGKESSTQMNQYWRIFIYVWRSGSGNVKTINTPTSCTTEHGTAEKGCVVTVTGAAGDFSILANDRIVVEIWADLRRTILNGALTATLYYEGTNATIVDGAAVSNAASYFICPQTLTEGGGDTTKPTYTNVGTNTTVIGQPCQLQTLWSDDTNVSTVFISHNNTGSWTYNVTATLVWINTTAVWANYTLTLNTTIGMVVGWYQISNDTTDNWNATMPIQFLIITPSTVATSTTSYAVTNAFQRKVFYDWNVSKLFWTFYCDGTNMVYKTSLDGYTWSSATSIGATVYGLHLSVWFDGTFLHYARFNMYILYYRRGIPESNGEIDWGGVAEQTVHNGTGDGYYAYPSIVVDSGGYAWIGTVHWNGTIEESYILKNANTDGTWSNATGFPYHLSETSETCGMVQPVPLTNLKVYVIYCYIDAISRGKLYNGTDWGIEESVANYNIQGGFAFSAVNEVDNVHIVYNNQTTYQIRYNKRTYGVGWAANDILVQDSVEDNTAPALCIDNSTNNLYCFWIKTNTDHIYYKRCVDETWGTDATDWIDESTDDIKYGYCLSCFYQRYESYIGLLYLTKTASPYNVKFAYLTILNTSPVINELRLSIIASEENITTITVNTWYEWEANLTDVDTLNDIVNLTVRIANNPALTIVADSASYNESSVYWFRYLNSTDAWEWYSGTAWTATSSWLDVANCSYPTKTGTNGWYLFRVQLSKIARYAVDWEFSALVYDSASNNAIKVFSGITINAYSEIIVVTTTHAWTNILTGATNVSIDEGAILINVTCNYQFSIQVEGNASYLVSSQAHQIAIGNVKVHKDTLGSAVNMTITYADVGGLTSLNTLEPNQQYSFKLWLTVPDGTTPWEDYQYKCYIQVSSA